MRALLLHVTACGYYAAYAAAVFTCRIFLDLQNMCSGSAEINTDQLFRCTAEAICWHPPAALHASISHFKAF